MKELDEVKYVIDVIIYPQVFYSVSFCYSSMFCMISARALLVWYCLSIAHFPKYYCNTNTSAQVLYCNTKQQDLFIPDGGKSKKWKTNYQK